MITLGESAILIGAMAADGGMGTNLAPLGVTLRDSCSITQADPEETEIFSEENDDPEFVVTRGGKINVNFSIMNPDVDTLVDTLGGKKVGTGDAAVWEAPANIKSIEKSCEIIPKQGLKFSIPRLKMACKIEWSSVGTTPLAIAVVGTVLRPENGEPKIKATRYVAEPETEA